MPPTGSTFTDWQQLDSERRLLIDEDISWSEPPARPRRRITDEPIRVRRRSAALDPEPLAERAEPLAERAPSVVGEDGDQTTRAHSHFDEMMREWNEAYGDAPEYAEAVAPAQAAYDALDQGYEPFDGDASAHGASVHGASVHGESAHGASAHGASAHGENASEHQAGASGHDTDVFDHDDLAAYAQAPVREERRGAFDLSDPGTGATSTRRTVVITGRGDERYIPAPRHRSPSEELRFHERSTFSPDRVALWAVLLGLALLIGAIAH